MTRLTEILTAPKSTPGAVLRVKILLTFLASHFFVTRALLRDLHHIDPQFLCDLIQLRLRLQCRLLGNELLLLLALSLPQLPLEAHSLVLHLQRGHLLRLLLLDVPQLQLLFLVELNVLISRMDRLTQLLLQ